jgi:MscS family membrane protein
MTSFNRKVIQIGHCRLFQLAACQAQAVRLCVFALLLILLLPHAAFAQLQPLLSQPQAVEEEPQSELATPRDTSRSILQSLANPLENRLSSSFITRPTSDLSRESIIEVIELFPHIVDRYGVLMPVALVSNNPDGSEENNLTSDYEQIGQIRAQGKFVPILLQRVTVRNGEKQWLVSRQTIRAISNLDLEITRPFIETVSTETLNDARFRGAAVSHWLAIPVALCIASLSAWLLYKGLWLASQRYIEYSGNSRNSQILSSSITPLCMIFGVFIFYQLELVLGLSILVRQDMSRLTVSVIWLALFILIWSLLNNLSSRGEQILREKNRVAGVSLIIFFKAIVKSILILVAIILILDNYGVDVTTGIAALGLGGIAIALGAQKAIENIVGSITIIVDQPFRVGDFCKMGELLGTVEHIGLRSTRIRTLSDTLVTFPNGELSTAEIENFTLRKKFLLRTTLNLRYETSSENMQEILSQLRDLLKNAKDVINDGIRVNFIAYGAASKDVEVFAYIRAADYAMFLAKQESVLLSMSKIVESNGSGFAFPSQTLYLSRDTAPSE